jgi:hypothetical protein
MTTTQYRSRVQPGRDGFTRTLRAEWVKFRTVRGWVIDMIVAALAIVALGLGPSGQGSCGTHGPASDCTQPLGPGGEAVTDSFYFVHQPLTGNGSITVSVSALTGSIPSAPGDLQPGIVPWAKAGLIIKESTRQGSAYAAIMVTSRHGVRMQDNYINDTAGWTALATRSPATTPPTAHTGPGWAPFTWTASDRPCQAGCSSHLRLP